ncbi:hypothetical protein FHR81_003462 [Actinoalloteichus hoggarensis]|uniref:Uncharacterized protein n=1 Tax=Actinoalloteichus hoggarensis TaxID=1470176 RepID=A0A221W788_9PSEU|nr:hypothetical protein AHOG_20980 [Actinoalloteichus hoggarensis]MBB5922410.1 hypothetical protein [Actinoalloteichus hoggarensis]
MPSARRSGALTATPQRFGSSGRTLRRQSSDTRQLHDRTPRTATATPFRRRPSDTDTTTDPDRQWSGAFAVAVRGRHLGVRPRCRRRRHRRSAHGRHHTASHHTAPRAPGRASPHRNATPRSAPHPASGRARSRRTALAAPRRCDGTDRGPARRTTDRRVTAGPPVRGRSTTRCGDLGSRRLLSLSPALHDSGGRRSASGGFGAARASPRRDARRSIRRVPFHRASRTSGAPR